MRGRAGATGLSLLLKMSHTIFQSTSPISRKYGDLGAPPDEPTTD